MYVCVCMQKSRSCIWTIASACCNITSAIDCPDFNDDRNLFLRQASFKLSWRCKGEQSDQHKHDIVSFERGNITTAERSSKQVLLLFSTQ